MGAALFHVDAFTDEPFSGNPAAVVVGGEPDPGWMQAVAAEMNLSETAFVLPDPDGGDGARFGLRWFTPVTEVDLCGHGTLAAAHVLWRELLVDADAIGFATRSGELVARRRVDGSPHGAIEIDLPANPATEGVAPPGLLAALGVDAARFASTRNGWCLVELGDEAAVRALAPDFRALAAHPVCVVTAPADPGADVASRVFGPSVGIDEDPVTGSAHCILATWWAERLGPALRARQVSARGGELGVRLTGDRVLLAGQAVTVARGQLAVPPRGDGQGG